ncbi:hypothetical protein ACOI1C_15400 [Bacillus sp. DJP31]|uniref:hypothetical protein n=1 Tax=Bacillus sp. DJP31 TaxID=3409789 RepID=UPI003BB4B782
MKKIIVPLLILGIVAIIESPLALEHERADFYSSIPAATEPEAEAELEAVGIVSLETELVKKEIIDGYILETYQEFEVIRDEEGEIIESAATSNFNYLRYHIQKP